MQNFATYSQAKACQAIGAERWESLVAQKRAQYSEQIAFSAAQQRAAGASEADIASAARAYAEAEAAAHALEGLADNPDVMRRLTGAQKTQLQKLIAFFKRMLAELRDLFTSKSMPSDVRDLLAYNERVADAWLAALSDASMNVGAGVDSASISKELQHSIVTLPDGKRFVKGDREGIIGDDPRLWAKEIEDYINNEIRNGRDVVVYSSKGTPLSITADTAGKAAFRNFVTLKDGSKRPMNNEEYAVKLRAEGHIDELAQISSGKGGTARDTKGHLFSKDGFVYREAYFLDISGYYKLTVSVGKNGRINTIYNVGRIEEADFPTNGFNDPTRSETEARNRASDEIVARHPDESNPESAPIAQEIASEKTSIKQVPALFKRGDVAFGAVNVDIGGGRFDLATEYLASEYGTRNLVFDPYNRGAEENGATLAFLQGGQRAETATVANVLNVIAEPEARANVILEAAKAIKPDGRAYFMVYEGDGSGVGRQTSAGWQNNRKTADYIVEIEQYFGRVERRGKLIVASEPRSDLPKASWEVSRGDAVLFSKRTTPPMGDVDEKQSPYDYSKTFAEQIDDWKAGRFPKRDTFVVGSTPEVFQKIGCIPLPMTYTQRHMGYNLNGTYLDPDMAKDHIFDENAFKQLPELLRDPIAIITSQSHRDTSIVAVIEIESVNGKRAIAAVRINGFGQQNSSPIDSYAVETVHGRNNTNRMLITALTNEAAGQFSVFYWNKGKATEAMQRAGLQLPRSLPSDGLLHTMHESGSPVKPQITAQTQTRQFKHWFGKSKAVNTDGTPMVLYHQTDAEFYEFDPMRDGAGKYDDETPHGIFLKTTSEDIGVRGEQQMPLYAAIRNPLTARDRAELSAWYKRNIEGYAEIKRQIEENDAHYKPVYDEADARATQWYEDHYDDLVNDVISEEEADRQMNAELDPILAEWKRTNNALRARAKKLLDDYFAHSEYDGIHLLYDGSRHGVDVETWIAFEPTQVKSATNNIGLFDPTNPDIRYSAKQGMRDFYDIGGKSSQNIPRFMAKYVKPWGSSVEEVQLSSGELVPSVKVTDAMKESALYTGQPMYSTLSIEEETELIAEANELYAQGVHYLDYQRQPDMDWRVAKYLRGMYDKSRQIEALQKALELYESGKTVAEYYADDPDAYDPQVGRQLRGMLIRNGARVGGLLSESELNETLEGAGNWKRCRRSPFHIHTVSFIVWCICPDETTCLRKIVSIR